MVPENRSKSLVDKDMFAVVVYAVFIGVALLALEKRQNKQILDLLGSIQALTLKTVNWAMLIAPLAVFGLLCDVTIRVGIELTLSDLLLLTATTVGASIGTPSTLGVGIVILATILQGVGVPTTGIALILGVDRILDMCRTTVNVSGDLTACVVMDRWIGQELAAYEPDQALPEVT